MRRHRKSPSRSSPVPSPWLRGVASPQPIGLQLYTVRDLMQKDVEVHAAAGRRHRVPGGGVRGAVRQEPRKRSPNGSTKDRPRRRRRATSRSIDSRASLQGVVDEAQTLGNAFVVCPSIDEPPCEGRRWLAPNRRRLQRSASCCSASASASRTTTTTSSSSRSRAARCGYDILLDEMRSEVREAGDGPVLDHEGRHRIRWRTSRSGRAGSRSFT